MAKTPKWQERLDGWRPDLQEKPVSACFKRQYNSVFPYITAILHHDEIALSASAFSARSIDKAAKLLTVALELADECDLELQGNSDASNLTLFREVYWKNFETGAFITANFNVSINFEPTSAECTESNPYFLAFMDAAVIDGSYDLRVPYVDEPKNIVGLKSFCKKFYTFMNLARRHPDIMAPFGRFDELPTLPGVSEQDIFRISYVDRNGQAKKDRFCMMRRSIYSMPVGEKIKWIEAYSEAERMMVDIRLSNVSSIFKENQTYFGFSGSTMDGSCSWISNGEWAAL